MNICICYVDTAAVPYCGYHPKIRRLFLYAHWHVFDDTIRSHRLVLMLCLLLVLLLILMLSLLLSSRDVHYINIE